MPESHRNSTRPELLDALMTKIEAETYPSATMLDMVESLLTEDDVPAYTDFLMSKIRDDTYSSISLINRVRRFA